MSNPKIDIIDLFSGYGGFSLGFEQAGFEVDNHYFSEVDVHAIANYRKNFPHAKYLGSVVEQSVWDIPRTGNPLIITFGSPCFVAGTPVLTENGNVNIEDIVHGTKVLTHKGRYMPVVQRHINKYQGLTYKFSFSCGVRGFESTSEHPFLVSERITKYNSSRRNYDVSYSAPEWVKASDVKEGQFMCIPKQVEFKANLINEECAYLMGYYTAEGWRRKDKRKRDGGNYYTLFFAMNENEKEHFAKVVSDIHYEGRFIEKENITVRFDNKYEGKACKGIISNKSLWELMGHCGDGAENKKIPNYIFNHPINIQKAFLDGYMKGDGCLLPNKQQSATTVSSELAYSLQRLVLSVYGKMAKVYLSDRYSIKHEINKRKVSQKPSYTIRWNTLDNKRNVNWVNIDDFTLVKIKNIETKQTTGNGQLVYNIGVEGDESYCTGLIVGHNCQDFSLAGRREGLGGAKSSLIEYALLVIERLQPDFFVWENVKGVFSSNAGADFWAIIQAFANLGPYRLEWELVNSSWFVPQNRERVYVVGHLAVTGRSFREVFPIGESGGWDDEQEGEPQGEGQRVRGYDTRSNCISARYGKDGSENLIKVGSLNSSQDGQVYSDAGLSPCLSAGHGNMPKVAINSAIKSGYEEAADGDSINLSMPNSKTRRGRVGKGVAQTLDTQYNQAVIQLNSSKESGGTQPYQQNRVYDANGFSPCLDQSAGRWSVKPVLTPDRAEKRQNGRRIKEDGEPAFTLTAQDKHGVEISSGEQVAIRRLTEVECERLQGLPDFWTKWGMYENKKTKELELKEISSTQRYKMCGNGVTVDVVKAIAGKIKLYFV